MSDPSNQAGFTLQYLGFKPLWTEHRKEGFADGRIVLEHKHMYRIYAEDGEWLGELSGKFRHDAAMRDDYPAVGDWVWLSKLPGEGRAIIHGVYPRISKFSRKAAGSTMEEQIVAANIDRVFLVMALNQDFHLSRMERYLLIAYESGAQPEIVLTKKDLCPDLDRHLAEVEAIAFGVPVYAVNSLADDGIEALEGSIRAGETIALLGSSGAGKSTLLNRLYGEARQKTGGVREGDDRGKHTTTHRELVVLPGGAMIIDTPGMRELQLWEGGDAMSAAFADIGELTARCRFADCSHGSEPGCAIRAALADGTLQQERYASFVKLQRELAYAERRNDAAAARVEKERWKKIHKQMRERGSR